MAGPGVTKPCIRTVETGKHELRALHFIKFGDARIFVPMCPSCGWVDTETIIKDVLSRFGGVDYEARVKKAVEEFRERAALLAGAWYRHDGYFIARKIRALPTEPEGK